MNLQIAPMTEDAARTISTWQYEPEYALYDMDGTTECIAELLNGTYYVATDECGEVVGFYCYGDSAQVPTGEEFGVYANPDYLDFGLGMRPDLTGHGEGQDFLLRGLQFARENFAVRHFRLTVAAFNQRAIKLYLKVGFTREKIFLVERGDSISLGFITMQLD